MTARLPFVSSVPVLGEGVYRTKGEVLSLLGHSLYITDDHLDVLRAHAERLGLDAERVLRETDPSTTMEGLYIKCEEGGIVTARMKFVRAEFLQCVFASESHWQQRPIVPNLLREGGV